MHIVNILISFDLPYVQTLKGRRKILNSIKDRLSKLNISLLDISSEYPKEAELAIVFLAFTDKDIQKKLQNIKKVLDRYFSDIDYTISYELI